MSVKIELLDYKYKTSNKVTWSNSSITNWSNGTGITSTASNGVLVSTTAGVSGFYSGFTSAQAPLINSNSYTFSYDCTSLDNAGLWSSQVMIKGSGAGNSSYRPISDNVTVGFHSYTFIMDDSLNNGAATMQVFFQMTQGNLANKNIKISNVALYNNTIGDSIDWDNSVVGELDVTDHSDFPLAMTFQISDFKDLTSTSGNYSKTFKIPATKNNNNILKQLYIPNINVDNKLTEQKPCRLLFNNLYSLVGLLQIDGVGGYGEKASYYNCVFFGSNLSWANKIQYSYINDIIWGDEGVGLIYNKNGIVPTWQYLDSDNADSSPIVYPITSYGEYNELGDERTIQLLDTASTQSIPNGSTGYYGFNDDGYKYGTPPPRADWRPSIFVKTTLEKIFSQIESENSMIGYKINSAFMQTPMFKKLVWLLPNFEYNNSEERAVLYGYGNHFTGEGLISSLLINPTNDQYDPNSFSEFTSIIDLNDAGSDFVLNTNTDNTGWDSTTGIFTVQEYGEYTTILNNFGLFATRDVYNGGVLNVDYAKIQLQVQTVGQSSWVSISEVQTGSFSDAGGSSPIETEPDASQGFTGAIDNTRYFNKDDKLRLVLFVKAQSLSYSGNQITLHLFGSSTPNSATTSDNANAEFDINIEPTRVAYGQTYNLKDVMSPDYKQVDFVKGVAHAFNLQMTTDEGTRTVNIEPYDSFYEPYSKAIDWTYKLDRSNQTNDKWLSNDVKRTLIFKYLSDSEDAMVKSRGKLFFHDIEDEYPYREILPETFKKGESVFENPFFAGTYNAKDTDTISNSAYNDTAYSGCLWTEIASANDAGRPDKGFNFLPRLLYWNKYSPDPSNLNGKRAFTQTWSNSIGIVSAGVTGSSGLLSTIYPQATMVNRDSTTSPNLAYGNAWVRDYDNVTRDYTPYQDGKGLYDTYYRNMMEGLKRSPRLRTVSITLNISDIINLDFKKLIYIDGVYWRLNRIIDYKPNKNVSTKVELIEWFQITSYAGSSPMTGDSGIDINPDGGIITNNNNIGL